MEREFVWIAAAPGHISLTPLPVHSAVVPYPVRVAYAVAMLEQVGSIRRYISILPLARCCWAFKRVNLTLTRWRVRRALL